MKNILLINLLLLNGAAEVVLARTLLVDIKKDLPSPTINLYAAPADQSKGKLSALAQLKDYEIHLKWSECSTQAAKILPTQKDLRGWVAVSWLHCLEQGLKKKTFTNIAAQVAPALEILGKHDEVFARHEPWVPKATQSWLNLRLMVLDDMVQKKKPKTETAIDNLLSGTYSLTKDQRSQAYRMLGDLALAKVNYSEAQFFYEEAQDQSDSPYLQEKIDFLMMINSTRALPTKVPVDALVEVGEELKIEERIRQSIKRNELVAAIEDTVRILNQYSGSRTARRLKDRPLEIYNQISDSSAKIQALDKMQEADGTRVIDWAQNLHRRADYAGSMILAQSVYDQLPGSVHATSSLWIIARSAHFLGNYDRALENYSKLIQSHSGADESSEALFRSALIHFRKQAYLSASALLDRLLTQNKDRYDLSGRYWLVRALQGSKSDRAVKEALDLMSRYPFSYYGLRLRAEATNQKLTWPEFTEKAPVLKTEFYLVGAQKGAWRRFKKLSMDGWVSEAQVELASLPFIKDPTVKMSLAEKLSQHGQHIAAIRLINEAMEEDPRLRREQFIKVGYPKIFETFYKTEAERYGLSPVLLRSVTRQESGFNLRAVSTSNALGLMQMIPSTASEVAKKLGLKIELPDDMFRPEVNILMGSFYLSQMLDQFQNSVPFALAAYNAGPSRLKDWIEYRAEIRAEMQDPSASPEAEIWFDELPWIETSFYVKAILRNILLYRLVEDGSFTLKPVLWQELVNKKAK